MRALVRGVHYLLGCGAGKAVLCAALAGTEFMKVCTNDYVRTQRANMAHSAQEWKSFQHCMTRLEQSVIAC
jgi:hypothetical protein